MLSAPCTGDSIHLRRRKRNSKWPEASKLPISTRMYRRISEDVPAAPRNSVASECRGYSGLTSHCGGTLYPVRDRSWGQYICASSQRRILPRTLYIQTRTLATRQSRCKFYRQGCIYPLFSGATRMRWKGHGLHGGQFGDGEDIMAL